MKEINSMRWIHPLRRAGGGFWSVEDIFGRHIRVLCSTSGLADLIGICEGEFFALKLIGEDDRLSASQQRFIDGVNAHGGQALVVRSSSAQDNAGNQEEC
jgi:hypothetical protein